MSNIPDKKIIDFLSKQKIFTLATSVNQQPYCAICFYSYAMEENCLYFMSKEKTRHSREAMHNPSAAGSITSSGAKLKKLKGLQFTGFIKKLTGNELQTGKKHYFKRFPYAKLAKGTLWGLKPDFIKLTDNSLGRKITWEKKESLINS